MPLDVTELASIKAAAAELNGKAIDLLLNNAGVRGEHGNAEAAKRRHQASGEIATAPENPWEGYCGEGSC